MKKVTATYRVPIKVKPEVAFAFISDLAQHGEWNDHLSVEALTRAKRAVNKFRGAERFTKSVGMD